MTHAEEIADAVGDEFGWCEPEPTGQKWCVAHGCVWLYGDRCDRARDVYLAAETAVESVLAVVERAVKSLPCPILGAPHSSMGMLHDCHVKRAEVLAIILDWDTDD